MNTEIDIKSTTINKSIDLIKDFLNKLIGPAVDEVGLLFADNVKLWRLKNQIRILERAKEIAGKNNVEIRSINLKLLVPLLENCSLEEDFDLQEKWANLLVSLADVKLQLTSNIFPYILSQLNSNEAKALLDFYKNRKIHYEDLYKKYHVKDEQISNLVRLGLIKRSNPEIELISDVRPIDSRIENNFVLIESEYSEITELGIKFIKIINRIDSH